MRAPSKLNFLVVIISIVIALFVSCYQPLPDDFPQPWKYRFLSYWAYKAHQFGTICEHLNLFTRIDLVRKLHYLTFALFQKRFPECRLKVYDRQIGNVLVRFFEPEESIDYEKKTTMIYFHGGGFLLGSIETYDQATYLLANLTRITVVSVEYRLAPEHRFPSSLEDCLTVSRELFQHENKYNINSKRIIMSGDSAGGNLALVASQKLIDDGYRPYLITLLYPSLQFFDLTLPSYEIYLKKNILGVLNEENFLLMLSLLNEKSLQAHEDIFSNGHVSHEDYQRLYPYIDPRKYLSNTHQSKIENKNYKNQSLIENFQYLISSSMSPLLVADEQLKRLPTILLFTTEFDILRDEGFIFASRLKSLNQTIYHHHFSNGFHGAHVFLYGPLRFEIAHQMIQHTSHILCNYL